MALVAPGATIGIVATLMVGVFPKILPVFQGLNIKLPITTKILIATSEFMTAYTIYLIIGVLLFVFSIWFIAHYDFGPTVRVDCSAGKS